MLAAYAQAGFLTTTGQPAGQADLAVVVTPQTMPNDGSADQLDQVLVPLATELAASSSATVVAGTQAGSGPGSPIAVLRSNNVANQVSTVDDADLVSGQTVVIQALAAMLAGARPRVTGSRPTAPAPSPRVPRPHRPPPHRPSATPSTKKKAK